MLLSFTSRPVHTKRSVVVNLNVYARRSLGSGPTWPTSGPDAVINEVLANLVYAGLVVSVSAGNSGGISGYAAGGLGLCGPALPVHIPPRGLCR